MNDEKRSLTPWRIKRTKLEDKLFTAFRVALMHRKAAYRRVLSGVVRQIKVSRYRPRCIFVISFDVTQIFAERSPILLPVSPMNVLLRKVHFMQ